MHVECEDRRTKRVCSQLSGTVRVRLPPRSINLRGAGASSSPPAWAVARKATRILFYNMDNHFESLAELEKHVALACNISTLLIERIQDAEAKCFAKLCLNNLECSQHQLTMVRFFLESKAYGPS